MPPEVPELSLTEFQSYVEKGIYQINGRLKHCGRSAYRHLRRAWQLREIAPEIAAFCATTAEEEAATALILSVKSKKYSGAEFLNHRNHVHKLAITPFLEVTAKVFEHLEYAMPKIVVSTNERSTQLSLRLDINKLMGKSNCEPLYGESVLPLDFVISDQDGIMDFSAKFAEFVAGKGELDVLTFVEKEANLRNILLYASDNGIAHVEFPDRFFEGRVSRVTALFGLVLMIEQSPKPQLFVSQCLDALLRILKKFEESQFTYKVPDDATFTGLKIERPYNGEPTATLSVKHVVDFTYRWLPTRVFRHNLQPPLMQIPPTLR